LWIAAYVDAAYLVSIESMSLKHRLANDQPSPHHLSLTRNLITCSLVTSSVTQKPLKMYRYYSGFYRSPCQPG
jgi:hypothetical protein